ncbi:hypothetical protein SmJEL517_g00123 [Synchytrium microbalum]|uniref:TIR domain-containing protein n=1 Tax=Synchytrium microbalum TaxID=1806994 RepID=A0A507CJY1_9FUNG|nr:uncharacterized protein SmJEL517_g00123 [Synchytrium microbalum]TPX38093.1 hypothetical protein SmJEL517_g00123 [Synchytrium microbalum]
MPFILCGFAEDNAQQIQDMLGMLKKQQEQLEQLLAKVAATQPEPIISPSTKEIKPAGSGPSLPEIVIASATAATIASTTQVSQTPKDVVVAQPETSDATQTAVDKAPSEVDGEDLKTRVFISYCWANSKKQVDMDIQNGVKSLDALDGCGPCDPRDVADWVEEHDYRAWLDVKELGEGQPLYGDLVEALSQKSAIVIAHISDAYATSKNCKAEFAFSRQLDLPLIPVIVGKRSIPPPATKAAEVKGADGAKDGKAAPGPKNAKAGAGADNKKPKMVKWEYSEIMFELANTLYIDAREGADMKDVQMRILRAIEKYKVPKKVKKAGDPVSHLTLISNLFDAAGDGSIEDLVRITNGKDLTEELAKVNDGSRTPLHEACANGRLDVAKWCIDNGALIETKDASGATPFYLAAQTGNLDLCEYLIDRGADIETTNTAGSTTLHAAAGYNRADLCRFLIDKGVSVDVKTTDDNKETPLITAASRGSLAACEVLVTAGANVSVKDEDGRTPFYVACRSGSVETAQLLYATKQVDLESRNYTGGFTPLLAAASDGQLTVVEWLISLGANTKARNFDGSDSFFVAIDDGHENIIDYFLSHGYTDYDAPQTNGGATPLLRAANYGQRDIIEKLLEQNPSPNINARDSTGDTALTWATYGGHTEIVELLVARRCEVNYVEWNTSQTALYMASNNGYVQIVKLLLENGARTDLCADGGWSPLNAAADDGYTDVVQLLIDAGADINMPNTNGYTPLMSALANGRTDTVAVLLKAGAKLIPVGGSSPIDIATNSGNVDSVKTVLENGGKDDINLVHDDGETCLVNAAKAGYFDIVKALVEGGADVDLTTTDGMTPLHAACSQSNVEVIKYLLEKNPKNAALATQNGFTPLITAITNDGTDKTVRALMTAPDLNIERRDYTGETAVVNTARSTSAWKPVMEMKPSLNNSALEIAIDQVDLDVVQALVKAGADIKQLNNDGECALDRAASKCNTNTGKKAASVAIFKYLLSPAVGAKPTKRTWENICDSDAPAAWDALFAAGPMSDDFASYFGLTALNSSAGLAGDDGSKIFNMLIDHGVQPTANTWFTAAAAPRSFAMRKLLDMGQDVTIVDESSGDNALMTVVKTKAAPDWEDQVRFILYRDRSLANSDVLLECVRTMRDTTNEDGSSGESLSTSRIARFLLDLGVPADEAHETSLETPLGLASACGDAETVSFLLIKNADPNKPCGTAKQPPLYLAAEAGCHLAVVALLNRGANVDGADPQGKTSLMCAAEQGYIECVETLLAHKATVNIKTVSEDLDLVTTPLHLAVRDTSEAANAPYIVVKLIEAGADVNALDGFGCTPIFRAMENTTDVVYQLVLAGAKVDTPITGEMTTWDLTTLGTTIGFQPIHWAAFHGNETAILVLVQYGAAIDATSQDGFTALMIASAKGNTTAVELLIQKGASITKTDLKGRTPIVLAIEAGNYNIIDTLAKHGATIPDPLLVTNKSVSTVLYNAIDASPDEAVLMRLLDAGADPSADVSIQADGEDAPTVYSGLTHIIAATSPAVVKRVFKDPRVLAIINKQMVPTGYGYYYPINQVMGTVNAHDLLPVFLEHGADVNQAEPESEITPIMSVIKGGSTVTRRLDVIKTLLEKGANVHAKDNSGFEIYAQTIQNSDVETFCFLSDTYPELLAARYGTTEQTPLIMAAPSQWEITSRLIINYKADVNAADTEGKTALIAVCADGDGDAGRLQQLLDAGADVNGKDSNGMTAWLYAAQKGYIANLYEINKRGLAPPVDSVNKDNQTALILASQSSMTRTSDYLLTLGNKFDSKDVNGNTPLHYAAENTNIDLVNLLLKAGADPLAANTAGETPRSKAEAAGVEVVILALGGTVPPPAPEEETAEATPEEGGAAATEEGDTTTAAEGEATEESNAEPPETDAVDEKPTTEADETSEKTL